MIGVAAAEKGTEKIATAGRDVEEAGLKRRCESEAGIQDVADWCQEGVHVPD